MITMTDLFCGAGGSSTGAIQVPGVTVAMAANHWDKAIATHNTNHPDTRHDCADISQVDPRRYPRTDILWASPECTNHSVAKGKKRVDAQPDMFDDTLPDEAAERSRATMWDVPRFAEHHRYRAIIVENVVDAAKWVLWDSWRHAMTALGYSMQVVYLNSMHAQGHGLPAPQSRDRMYVVATRKGERTPNLSPLRPRALCTQHGPIRAIQSWKTEKAWGRYRAQYVYRCPSMECRNQIVEPAWLPASSAIDWSVRGTRIGDREKPLAPRTMGRIEAGIKRYAAEPFMTVHRGDRAGDNNRTSSLNHPTPALTASGNHFGLLIPVEGRDGKTAQPASDPMRTMTTRNETGVVVMLRGHNTAKHTQEPFDTFAAAGFHHALVMRNNNGGAEMSTPVTEPLRTLTTAGHQSLIQWGDLLVDYNGPARHVTDVLPTQTTVEGDAVASVAVDPMDCLFRMLEPSEIARGMAFPTDYIITGNRREQVRQAGNAVTPPAARDLIACVADALSGAA
jgi:DNA (cytosine-5)-methyltransferase 1